MSVPKSTARHIAAGTRGTVRQNPTPPRGRPKCPATFDPQDRAEWRRLVGLLEGMKVLSKADADLLETYVKTLRSWRQASAEVERDGTTFRTEGGQIKRNPAVAIAQTALNQLAMLAREFGLTPLSRNRLDVRHAPTAPVASRDKSRFFPQGIRIAE